MPDIMPIEIRPDYFVQIMGIPHDLTAEEARKIAAVVLAMGPGGYVIAVDPSPEYRWSEVQSSIEDVENKKAPPTEVSEAKT